MISTIVEDAYVYILEERKYFSFFSYASCFRIAKSRIYGRGGVGSQMFICEGAFIILVCNVQHSTLLFKFCFHVVNRIKICFLNCTEIQKYVSLSLLQYFKYVTILSLLKKKKKFVTYSAPSIQLYFH